MEIDNLKRGLVSYIEKSNDEEMLSFLMEDLLFYTKSDTQDVTEKLNEEQLNELIKLAKEDENKDVITPEIFRKATNQWRVK